MRASVFSSNVAIYKAMGGGWVTQADALTGPAATPVQDRDRGIPPLF